LVSLFYTTNIDSPFNQENYNSRIESLIEISSKGISGESSGASEKVTTFLTAIAEKNTSANINFINQP
jgi:predicted sulfurtransferase